MLFLFSDINLIDTFLYSYFSILHVVLGMFDLYWGEKRKKYSGCKEYGPSRDKNGRFEVTNWKRKKSNTKTAGLRVFMMESSLIWTSLTEDRSNDAYDMQQCYFYWYGAITIICIIEMQRFARTQGPCSWERKIKRKMVTRILKNKR